MENLHKPFVISGNDEQDHSGAIYFKSNINFIL